MHFLQALRVGDAPRDLQNACTGVGDQGLRVRCAHPTQLRGWHYEALCQGVCRSGTGEGQSPTWPRTAVEAAQAPTYRRGRTSLSRTSRGDPETPRGRVGDLSASSSAPNSLGPTPIPQEGLGLLGLGSTQHSGFHVPLIGCCFTPLKRVTELVSMLAGIVL